MTKAELDSAMRDAYHLDTTDWIRTLHMRHPDFVDELRRRGVNVTDVRATQAALDALTAEYTRERYAFLDAEERFLFTPADPYATDLERLRTASATPLSTFEARDKQRRLAELAQEHRRLEAGRTDPKDRES